MEVKNSMAEQNNLVWDEEVENLDSSGSQHDYFKPDKGNQEVTFLDDGTVYMDQKKFDDQERQYVKFLVEVDGDEMLWDMAKGTTPNSKFGQIARYAKAVGGLEGETVTWFRQGSDQDTTHVLMDLEDVEDSDSDVVFSEDE